MADLSGDELNALRGHFLFQGMDAAAVAAMAGGEGCRLDRGALFGAAALL